MQKPILITIFIISTILLVIFLVYPKYQDSDFIKKKLEQKKEEFIYQQDYYEKINMLNKKLEEYKDELKKIDSALPDEPSLPALYDYFLKLSSQNGLILTEMSVSSPAVSKADPYLQEILFSISVSGTYTSFKNFLFPLYKSARMIEVESISLAGGEEGEEEKGAKEEVPTEAIFGFNLQLKTHAFSPYQPAAAPEESLPLPEEEMIP